MSPVRYSGLGGGGRRNYSTTPMAWRHILLNGHYTFQSNGNLIDLDALVAGLELG
ncbi:transposase [Xanthomonas phaseoli pv. syngonii LMG 9055]|uniref:Transposase n=1 Tax=Xanthomonas phaseoli pv. syngonii LMG 9055 TaxID=1437878 RepID=A0A1V9HG49_9XANT|nr:transposase [Xanthomonas phaseoli pv. syngonii LMG 9055]